MLEGQIEIMERAGEKCFVSLSISPYRSFTEAIKKSSRDLVTKRPFLINRTCFRLDDSPELALCDFVLRRLFLGTTLNFLDYAVQFSMLCPTKNKYFRKGWF